ncbi:MAG: DUF3520 domain-containing protein [Bacteroidetes bacterium]|nr:DUF3520 domain-containing protein [Bacteroidota bacterium]
MKKNDKNEARGLENLPQYEPRPDFWDSIEQQLDREKRPAIFMWHWTKGLAASLILLAGISFLLRNQKFGKNDVATETRLQETPINPHQNQLKQVDSADEKPLKYQEADSFPQFSSVKISTEKSNPKPVNSVNNLSDSVIISYNFTSNGAISQGDLTYQWDFGDNFSQASAPVHSYSVPQGNYFVTTNKTNVGLKASGNAKHQGRSDMLGKKDINAKPISRRTTWANNADTDADGVDDYYDKEEDQPQNANYDRKFKGKSDTIFWEITPASPKYDPWDSDNESYAPLVENTYLSPLKEPLSTFGIDVDNASYTVMRTKLNSNFPVPKDAIRVEEFVNYFQYGYGQPKNEHPFAVHLESAACPWNEGHQLVRIGLKGKDIDMEHLGTSNLVFLIDVSGSMDEENKLPLVKSSLKLLVDQLGKNDRIAIVTYAGSAGLALPSTRCDEKDYIKKQIDQLEAGGSTAGGEGIKLAYNVAMENLLTDGNNRVILCTDGDFNVGASSDGDMKNLIVGNRDKNIFITVCGFGMGNYKDSKMETIADNGNGNYFYIDNRKESSRVFERDLRATLFTIAKDVKIQVEFNPAHVKAYRLIGYENRIMPAQDFNDDTKDGGELGAGHTVTALYEIIPANSKEEIPGEVNLKYQKPATTTSFGNEMLTVKLRYKQPKGTKSILLETSLNTSSTPFSSASRDFKLASGVAMYAQILRQSQFVPQRNFATVKSIIRDATKGETNEDVTELLKLIELAETVYMTKKD